MKLLLEIPGAKIAPAPAGQGSRTFARRGSREFELLRELYRWCPQNTNRRAHLAQTIWDIQERTGGRMLYVVWCDRYPERTLLSDDQRAVVEWAAEQRGPVHCLEVRR